MQEEGSGEQGVSADLTTQVLAELIELRGSFGRLTIEKFSKFETLRLVCGGNDLVDAFMMFRREMRRFQAAARNEAAAAYSICIDADTVLDRLTETANLLSDGELKDQRTARRWSDAGLGTIASELAHLAEISGRLGIELLSVEVTGTAQDGIVIVIGQMTKVSLPVVAPMIRLWSYSSDDDIEEREISVDLQNHPATRTANNDYAMQTYRVRVAVPATPKIQAETKLLAISIEGHDAPMRTVSIEDKTSLPVELTIRFAVYRTIVAVELLAHG